MKTPLRKYSKTFERVGNASDLVMKIHAFLPATPGAVIVEISPMAEGDDDVTVVYAVLE